MLGEPGAETTPAGAHVENAPARVHRQVVFQDPDLDLVVEAQGAALRLPPALHGTRPCEVVLDLATAQVRHVRPRPGCLDGIGCSVSRLVFDTGILLAPTSKA